VRLRALEIEHFGIFAQCRLELPGDGLHVLFGANEAGKSTLLQLIREVLFGFPVRSGYVFPEHAGELAATATLELADGTALRFRRRKGRVQEVVGEVLATGDPLDKAALQRYLGHASAELFQHVFGFSLQELAAGEQSLQDARLSEALYGGALGALTRFQAVLGDVAREQEQLFAPTATKRPINQLLSALRNQHKALKAAQVRPKDYEAMVQAAGELDAEINQLRESRDALRREHEQCGRLLQAVSLWRAICRLRAEHSTLGARAGVPRDAWDRFQALRTQCARATAECADLERDRERLASRLRALAPRDELLAAGPRIEHLSQRLEQIRGFRTDIDKRHQESQQIKSQVASLLSELDPSWSLSHLAQFRTGLARRCALEDLQLERGALEREHRELQSQRPALLADIQAMRQRAEEIAAELADPALVDLLDTAPTYQALCEQVAALETQQRELTLRSAELQVQVQAPWAGVPADLHQLPVPPPALVTEHRQRLAALDQLLARVGLRHEQAGADYVQRTEELALARAAAQVADRAQLQAARVRRDHLWQLLRRRYVHGDRDADAAIRQGLGADDTSVADAYERAVAAADGIADQRQQHAEVVARQEQLAADVNRLEQRRTHAATAVAEAQQRRDAAWQEWLALWAPCGIAPHTPEVMVEWLGQYHSWQRVCAQHAALAAQLATATASIRAFEAELARLLPAAAGSAAARLGEARRRVKRSQESAAERKTYERQLPRKEQQLSALDHQLAELDLRHQDWQRRWQTLLTEFEFPAHWDVHVAVKVLQGLSQARAQHDLAAALDQRIADMQQGLDAFEQDVGTLCRDVAPSLLDLPAERAVEELVAALADARAAARERVLLQHEQQRVESQWGAKRQQVDELQRGIAALWAAAAATGEDEFRDVAQRAQRAWELREQLERLDAQLRIAQGAEDTAAFEAALQAADAAELESRRQLRQRELEQADAAFNAALQRKGTLDEQARRLDLSTQAAEIAQQIEDTRSQLRDAVDQWVPLVLARYVMQQALLRFEREHQPQMLRDVSRLFARMTLGRYTDISRRLDEQGTLQVRQTDGRQKTTQQLSTGTREQLYLAIRLAYVLHYCREAEPLPIVMDDVLVNFDDERAAATLDALLEVAAQVQVLLMTCHRSTVALVRQRLPHLAPRADNQGLCLFHASPDA
jgi:uncharacterized protein YhaN